MKNILLLGLLINTFLLFGQKEDVVLRGKLYDEMTKEKINTAHVELVDVERNVVEIPLDTNGVFVVLRAKLDTSKDYMVFISNRDYSTSRVGISAYMIKSDSLYTKDCFMRKFNY